MLRLEGESLVIGDGCNLCGACVEVCVVEARRARNRGTGPPPSATPPDGVWVVAEQRRGELAPVTLELLGEARRLAEVLLGVKVAAVLLGDGVAPLSDALLTAGANQVYLAEHPLLGDFVEETYAAALTELARKFQPEIILAGATYPGRAFIPQVAAALKTGLTADCTAFAIDAEKRLLLQTRPAFGGNIMATIITPRTVPRWPRPGPASLSRQRPRPPPTGEVIRVDLTALGRPPRSRFVGTMQEIKERIPLNAAEVIVAGGRGLKEAKHVKLLEELAHLFGGAVGATRAAVERRLDSLRPTDRPDWQDGFTQALYRLRYFRRHAAPGGDAILRCHRGHQQRPAGADISGGRRGSGGGPVRDRSGLIQEMKKDRG